MIDLFPSVIYRDPLTSISSYNYSSAKSREEVSEGDFLVNIFIKKLDEEIFANTPKGLSEELYESLQHNILFARCADCLRLHGWIFVEIYEDNSFEVFTETERADWVLDEEKNKIGVKLNYSDDAGKLYDRTVMFEEGFFYQWYPKKGVPTLDLSLSIWTLATQIRNIRFQLLYASAKPGFLHFKYGPGYAGAPDSMKQDLADAITYADQMNGIGATEALLESVNMVRNEAAASIIPSLQEMMQFYAGATRLPLAFYTAKEENGGLSDVGSKITDVRIMRKKDYIFQAMVPLLKRIYAEVYGIVITDLEMGQEMVIEDEEGT